MLMITTQKPKLQEVASKIQRRRCPSSQYCYENIGGGCSEHPRGVEGRRAKNKRQMVATQDNCMITPCNFSIYDSTNWVLDTKYLINICTSLQGL